MCINGRSCVCEMGALLFVCVSVFFYVDVLVWCVCLNVYGYLGV